MFTETGMGVKYNPFFCNVPASIHTKLPDKRKQHHPQTGDAVKKSVPNDAIPSIITALDIYSMGTLNTIA